MEETNETVEEEIEMTPGEVLIEALHDVIEWRSTQETLQEVQEELECLENTCSEMDEKIGNVEEIHESLVTNETLDEAITNALETIEAPILEARIKVIEDTMAGLASVFEDFMNGY